EHNLEVIKTADWIIDLGPEAGIRGGEIVAEGTPEDGINTSRGYTARSLKDLLAAGPFADRPRFDPKAAARQALEAARAAQAKTQPQPPAEPGQKAGSKSKRKANGQTSAQPETLKLTPGALAPWEAD